LEGCAALLDSVTTVLSPNNRLFALARQGRRQPSALLAIAVVPVTLALMIASQIVARLLLWPILPGAVQSVADPIAEIIGFLSIYLGLWVWLHFWGKRPFRSLGFERGCVPRRILGGAFVAGLMVVAMAGLAMIPGASLAPGELRTKGLDAVGTGLLILLATLCNRPRRKRCSAVGCFQLSDCDMVRGAACCCLLCCSPWRTR